MAGYRLASGGARIDRAKPLGFTFDGTAASGFAGDSLASALLAGGRTLIGRSFKYHRPRGLYSAGAEEPNALVSLRSGNRTEPNSKAPMIELYDGLEATSQNRWPSLESDVMALNGLFAPFLAAGFYYKTFMGPTRRAWMVYEHFIRKAAGMGAATLEPDPDRYEKTNAFCDILVVGGGAAGLAAALNAGRGGARVILADENAGFGGALASEAAEIDGLSAADWIAGTLAELASLGNVTLVPRMTVYGYYDDNVLGAVERTADHVRVPVDFMPRERHWRIRARQVILATGAIERPIVFDGNDIPGVMLAGAARHYAVVQAAAAGRSPVVFANNDHAWQSAFVLKDCGVDVRSIVDARRELPDRLVRAAGERGIEHLSGHVVAKAEGGKALAAVRVAPFDAAAGTLGSPRGIEADCLLVSGGYVPTIHLASQAGGRPVFEPAIQAFVPGERLQAWRAVGACAGELALQAALASGARAGAEAAEALGFAATAEVPRTDEVNANMPAIAPLAEVPALKGRGKKFVDLQHDVTAEDVRLAHREGFRSVEHLKRYTTLGMACDQGKTSNMNGLSIMAAASEVGVPDVGTTRFRPPYTPVALGALAGREAGPHIRPVRRTPMHDWHVAHGAVMIAAGAWMRPQAYLQPGETVEDAYIREARGVRESVGIVDVSTLGKIDVQGPDAATFLDRLYTNGFAKLPVGKARYGLMLRDDGIVFDDGTTWRLAETRFLMTTTTANAAAVLARLEFLLATAWPDLKVRVASVTEQWSGVAISGPNARAVLQRLGSDIDFTNEVFPFMGVRAGRLAGLDVLVARLSFSGELAYEVYCGANHGLAMWEKLLEAGKPYSIVTYGMEALGTLRIEKGHVAGAELDGRTTPSDLGLDRMVSAKKDFVGKPLMGRPGLAGPHRLKLVGLLSKSNEAVRSGSQLVAGADPNRAGRSLGHVTASAYSPALERHIALALVEGGRQAQPETLYAAYPLRGHHVPVELVDPCFFDKDGSRMHV